jgi:flagellar motor switch protein FliM
VPTSDAGDDPAARTGEQPLPFDTASSGRLSRQRARLVRCLLDGVARQATDELRLWLDGLRVEAGDVEQRTVADHLDGAVDHAEVVLVERGERGLVVTELDLARSLVLSMLGGSPDDDRPARPLTPLEADVLDLLLVRLVERVGASFEVGPIEVGEHGTDRSASSLDDGDVLVGIPFRFSTTRSSGQVWVALPAGALQAPVADPERRHAGRPTPCRPTDRRRTEAVLHDVTVPVVCGFGVVRVRAGELAVLAPGDVVRTGHPTTRDLVLTVGGTPLYAARAGQRGLRLVAEILGPSTPRPLPGGTP